MSYTIPFNKPFIIGHELDYIRQAVEGGQLSGDGQFTRRCHAWLEQTLSCKKALLTHSCTASLEMAAILAGLGPGDEVVMPSFTFVSTANAVALRGAMPVFIDIRPDTLNMDETLIEAAITPSTKAILPVHYAGTPCAMDAIMGLAHRRGLYVIEDAAQALLSTYKDRYLGTIGDVGCISFHETKNIISGEGGVLLVNREAWQERAEIIREKGTNRKKFLRGQVDKYTWVDIGSSFLPSELMAAFLFAQLEHADKIVRRRCDICDCYRHGLADLAEQGHIGLPSRATDKLANGHLFYVMTKSLAERDALIRHLRAHGILSVFHYVPLHNSPAGLRLGRVHGSMEVTNRVSACLTRLPVFYEMTRNEVDRVIHVVQKFYGTSRG